MEHGEPQLLFDWNRLWGFQFRHKPDLELEDDTLRDGLQSPSAREPSLEQKLRLLHLMDSIGVASCDLGMPGAGPAAEAHIEALVREIGSRGLRIRPVCAVRAEVSDLEALAGLSERTGTAIEAATYIGSSPIRRLVEDWSLDELLRRTEEAVRFAARHGLPVTYVTEDTTRAHPDALRRLYSTAIRAGATRIGVADSAGHATPIGVRNLLHQIQALVAEVNPGVRIDWQGRSDRGLAIPNAMMAIAGGVDRVHATGLGIGERCGSTPMDQLVVNLKLEGLYHCPLDRLRDYVHGVAESTGTPIPRNYPVFGEDAFEAPDGTHAEAIAGAIAAQMPEVAGWVYSGVPAHLRGETQ